MPPNAAILDQKVHARVQKLLSETLAWDNHACMPLRAGDETFLPQIERARAAGFDVVSVNIGFGEQSPQEHEAMLVWFVSWFQARADRYRLIAKPGDILLARQEGKLGVFFDVEGASGIGDDLRRIARYYELGVRWMLIAYNRQNLAGSGVYDELDGGLTPFGRSMIGEMNRVGMTVCCSHTGERTAREALEASQQPVIFSHSNCAVIHPHPRNISDDLIRACAAQGGVVGINGIGDFLCAPGVDLVEAYMRHLDHAVQLVGPEHVGISLDYVYDQQELLDYLTKMKHTFPHGTRSEIRLVAPEALPSIVSRLIKMGYADADLALILGGNWLRIAEANWR